MKRIIRGLAFLFALTAFLFLTSSDSTAGFTVPEYFNQNRLSFADSRDTFPKGLPYDILKLPEIMSNDMSMPFEDPEGDAMQVRIFNGLAAGDYHGQSVSSAGDVNGDGIDDIIVGAYEANSFTGKAYIYFGGNIINTVADVIITGEAPDSRLGISVSSAGDVNADGYDDVIVGAFGYFGYTGRAFIYFGGSSMDNVADISMTGEDHYNFFGFSVASAGDVNGDGYCDAMIGATGYGSSAGKVYIYFGGIAMDNVEDDTIVGETYNNNFGVSVSHSDFNGDGYSDIVVGAPQYASYTGRVYVYYGSDSMNTDADFVMTGEAVDDAFGYSVSSTGDVNGDGFGDIVVGAYAYPANTGKAYIYYGGSSMDITADVMLYGDMQTSCFGQSLSFAGDVNGDGYSDIIVGAGYHNTDVGKAYLYFGGISMNNIADAYLTGETPGSYFGISVSSAGDMNGDGYADILVGAMGYNSNTGRVYLYDYFMKNELSPDIRLSGEAVNDCFGMSISSAGDVNGDGYDDLIIGASQDNMSGKGKAYLFLGGYPYDKIPDAVFEGETSQNSFGRSVSTAGDVNGDGYDDIIIGAFGFSSYIGRAYIYLGGTLVDTIADVILTGQATSNYFALSVSDAGDVNGDGYSDVFVGAPYYGGNYEGRAYIYYGGAAMDNNCDVYLTGEGSSYYIGQSVSCAGDVNADGYSDVIVGASSYNSGQGRATVYYGGSSMNSSPDLYFYGEATSTFFGNSVSRAGDVNGDGFDDVIAGSYNYGPGYGRAYIYLGGTDPDNIADVVMAGPTSTSYFGFPVSDAGDVNKDGYSDVVVGAHGYASFTGRAFVFYGGSSMNSASDFVMTGETSPSYFAYSVSSAGDINGDGYSDLIAGAYMNNNYTGKTYVYLGSAISTKPILLYAKDVPNDQGGKVNLKWARSGYDVNGNTLITDYLVQRSFPPTGGNFSWQNVAVVPASHESFYTYVDLTPADSGANNSGTFFYRITARTSSVNQYWRSAILSGRSFDNLSPPVVSPFTSTPIAGNVALNWKRSPAPDLFNYILYRSTSTIIDPNTEPVFVETTDSAYLDTSPLSGIYYYHIVAQDIHGNKSPVAVAESPGITLNLTMLIQGFYNAGTDLQVSDTITVELRNSVTPFGIADFAKSVLSSSGNVTLKFGNAPDGNYYLAVKHRNSIETWSANSLAVSRSASVSYDLTTSASQAFGSNLIQIDTSPVRFAVYSGDVNQDGIVDATDISQIDNDASNFVTGYVSTDLTGDEFVDGTDFSIADNNAANFVSIIVP